MSLEEIRTNVLDVNIQAYGYRQLLEIHEQSDDADIVDEDLLTEVCHDLNQAANQDNFDLVTAGFLMGISHAVEVLNEL
jgi:hypothetical protein